ncbi:tRNA (adenosine(37)-N6)-threonylcarbamoyltransferase complex dimerization subunit type 1 TsaB [Polynucleobacter sp. JS-JIR-II-c23]|uniref:tRNA (adenosine(37)-N6)-threonylcarbamoyltransferase complex dimerization subunit type 1 TsaB n=1 Tax=Polynucleobacter sp. JS-JIR-II-c23 TaxID=1758393 RepID=UPI002B2247A0|nr:tRNA (adenosine(37)-N6)-threonylcarbamoyltransferase complex dimerization subunit type 1 TsaB [Polynucleobacter sp. JS-JIR-II-c23]MEA9603979.1 tRNA (adenosine(37)-N6)-threonylcarbamoyltransferase complex dimerization subunit type 1 TsaB [Polynucleobacter sp. JS-JIR-II-c23]
MANILAIDTSSAWCSVALSLGDKAPEFRHEAVSAGASQLLLPWIESLLTNAKLSLKDLDAIAVGIGPGAFTGVRLGVAAVQGLAISNNLPVISVCSLDAIAAQITSTEIYKNTKPQRFMIAIDARMEEIYWASYESQAYQLPKRMSDIHLTKPEDLNFDGVQLLAGSALNAYGSRLPIFNGPKDAEISISALGVLECAKQSLKEGLQVDVRLLEPMYVRNKVAFTTAEREKGMK